MGYSLSFALGGFLGQLAWTGYFILHSRWTISDMDRQLKALVGNSYEFGNLAAYYCTFLRDLDQWLFISLTLKIEDAFKILARYCLINGY